MREAVDEHAQQTSQNRNSRRRHIHPQVSKYEVFILELMVKSSSFQQRVGLWKDGADQRETDPNNVTLD